MMLDAYKIPDVTDMITSTDFHSQYHALIFSAISEASEKGQPVDPIILAEMIGDNIDMSIGELMASLLEMQQSVTSSSHIKQYSRIVLNKSKERQVITAARNMMDIVTHGDGDSENRINDALACVNSIDLENEDLSDVAYNTQIKDCLAELEKRANAGSVVTGLSTGFEDIDKATGGLHHENLIIMAGTPGSGKSTMSMNIATNIARNIPLNEAGDRFGHVLVFNMEMSASEVIGRQIASVGSVRMDSIKSPVNMGNGNCMGYEGLNTAAQMLKDLPMTIDDRPALKPEQVRAKALRTKRKHGELSLIVIDYLQLMSVNNSKGNLVSDTTQISKSLKQLAKEFKCPVIALSQLNRKVMERTGGRPIMSDLRDSGSIEQDADIVAFVHRERVDPGEDNPMAGFAELIIAKNRSGETTSIPLRCDLAKNKFKDMAGETMPTPEPKQNQRGGFKRG